MMLSLNCLILGQASEKSLTENIGEIYTDDSNVVIGFSQFTVSTFKEKLFRRGEVKNIVQNIEEMDLWKVDNKKVEEENNLKEFTKSDIIEKLGGKEMVARFLFKRYFDVNQEMDIKGIHIFIVPTSTEPLNPIYSYLFSKVPSKREREKEAKASRKVQKIFGATSVSETRIFKTIAENSEARLDENKLELLYGIPNFFSFCTNAGIIFADKTMYIEQLEKNQSNYRYMFLRPRRFGKSAFLNMLCNYYDIHKADIFNDLFGPLYIGKNPTSWRNQHLVLKFDLSSISVSGSRDRIEASFNKVINDTLQDFIEKYGTELGCPEVKNVLDTSNASASLMSILKLAGKFGHTLFVGVDEYDAPANNSAFTDTSTGLEQTTLDNVAKLEQFFKKSFFAVLKQGCRRLYNGLAVISKYFLVGVTPAFRAGNSPLIEAVIVSDEVGLHGICGFTESEKLYNGYFFASSGYNKSDPQPPLIYNSHLVFHYLRKFSSHGLVAKSEESTAIHSTTILKSISNIGEFSVKDLEDLIINGSVRSKIKTEFDFSDLLKIGKNSTITWSLLYYLGILTHLKKLEDKLYEEDASNLLARNYMYWSEEQREPILTTVNNVMADGVKQLKKYMQTIKMGKPKSYCDSGVLDSRVIIDEEYDDLQEHVVIAIGRRILINSTKLMSTSNKYQRALLNL
ncbi:13703_t:CDS:2 [Funneliformis mosseae]|uniref:13703_t:CDS:1 n=1 Tax=Funneliformis mosseae TaxID=27381 RepID=A0A9N9ERX6_FUNMO|nr:13703_t:CDS:2 [Funneliformis mosseae]